MEEKLKAYLKLRFFGIGDSLKDLPDFEWSIPIKDGLFG
jgi:hypothetical protein